MLSTAWTDDRVERLKQHWKDGLSAAEIARRLGDVTRNAVLGKLHRLGLLGSRPRVAVAPRPSRRSGGRSAVQSRPPRTPRRAAPPPAPIPDWPGEVAGVEALQAHQCRWPIGDPRVADFRFCGRWAASGPYCPAHRAVAFKPASADALATTMSRSG